MQSEKPEREKWDAATGFGPEHSAEDATVSPGQDHDPEPSEQVQTPDLADGSQLPAQSDECAHPSLESNGPLNPVKAESPGNMFQRPQMPSSSFAAETDSPLERPIQSPLTDPTELDDSQIGLLASSTVEQVPVEGFATERMPFAAGRPTPIETPVQPVMPQHQSDLPDEIGEPEKPRGLLDLAPTEHLVREVDSGDDGRFVLTNMRLIYRGRSTEGALFAAAAVADVTSIEFGRRARDSRSAWWGVIGMVAAIAVWQVTTNESVGAIAGAVVAGISALLLADYWFRPPGLVLRFGTPGGAVEGTVSGKRVREAEELAAEVQQLRHFGGGQNGTGSGRPPASGPPGGSPRLY